MIFTYRIGGRVERRRARESGTVITIYDGEISGMDTFAGRWQTLCEKHHTISSHRTLAEARYWMAHPKMWCEDCQES